MRQSLNNDKPEIPFFDHLCCTKCGNDSLELNKEELKCRNCSARFPVKNGVPLFSYDYINSQGLSASIEKEKRSNIGRALPFFKKIYLLLMPPTFKFLQRGEDKLQKYINKQLDENNSSLIVDIGAGSKRWNEVVQELGN